MLIYIVIGWILWQMTAPAWVWGVFIAAAVIYLLFKGIEIANCANR